VSTE
jgi:hypothetical protein